MTGCSPTLLFQVSSNGPESEQKQCMWYMWLINGNIWCRALNAVVVTKDMKEFVESVEMVVALGVCSSCCTFVRGTFRMMSKAVPEFSSCALGYDFNVLLRVRTDSCVFWPSWNSCRDKGSINVAQVTAHPRHGIFRRQRYGRTDKSSFSGLFQVLECYLFTLQCHAPPDNPGKWCSLGNLMLS